LVAALVGSATKLYANDHLIAHYKFSTGSGDVLKDRSGLGHDGKIIGAKWQQNKNGAALRFDGKRDYIDFGDNSELKPTGDWTILVWIKLEPPAYPDYNTNWYVFDYEDYSKHGEMLRIDGSQAKLTFPSSRGGTTPSRFGTKRLENGGVYQVGFVRKANKGTLLLDGIANGDLDIGGAVIHDPTSFKLSLADQSFAGLMYDVKIFNRALSTGEIIRYDNRGRRVHHDFITTADADSVRTELKLGDDEIAIIEKLPVSLTTSSPVNMYVISFDEKSITLTLNGQGAVTINDTHELQLAGLTRVIIDLD